MDQTQSNGYYTETDHGMVTDRLPDAHPQMSPEQEIVYRLKTTIDERGRYAYRMRDLAVGYAAGKEISVAAARVQIEDHFEQQMGQPIQEYLDNHYAQLKQNSRTRSRGR